MAEEKKKKMIKNIIGETVPEQPFTENNKDVYTNLNKLHPMLWDYRVSSIKMLKGKFVEQLDNARAEEKKMCEARKIAPKMTNAAYDCVIDLLMQCTNFFEIEALARFLFDENEIPTYDRIKTRAYGLKLSSGLPFGN